jgi:hypothetical protein
MPPKLVSEKGSRKNAPEGSTKFDEDYDPFSKAQQHNWGYFKRRKMRQARKALEKVRFEEAYT